MAAEGSSDDFRPMTPELKVNVSQGGGEDAAPVGEGQLPPYPLPIRPYDTNQLVAQVQKVRDNFGVRTLFVEFIACFFFTFFIMVPTAAIYLTGQAGGSFLIAVLCVSVSVVFSIYIAAPHSGAILSPPIMICQAFLRGFPWKYVPFFLVAHFLGSFLAGVVSYGLLAPLLDVADGGNRNFFTLESGMSTAQYFIAIPSSAIDNNHLILSEILGDMLFMIVLLALLDTRNPLVDIKFLPFLVGADVFLVGCTFGWYGFVLNPFRDFGPRVYLSHYYDGLFEYHSFYSMIALFIPFIGHFIGAIIYDIMVSARYKPERNADNLLEVNVIKRQ